MALKTFGLWQDLTFYFVIEAQGDALQRAAGHLAELASAGTAPLEKLAAIRQETDHLLDQFIGRLDRAFITPLDKEDLDTASYSIDRIHRALESAAHYVAMAGGQLEPALRELIDTVGVAAAKVHDVAGLARTSMKREALDEPLAALLAKARSGEGAHRALMKAMLDASPDKVQRAMLAAECGRQLRTVLERCEEFALVMRRLAIKYG